MQKSRNKHDLIYALSVTAAMTALSVVFCRFLGFSPENSTIRFEFGFLPICIVAEIFGPLWCGVSYLLADIIGSLLSGYAPNPWISACKFLTGATLGLFLYRKIYKKPPTLKRNIMAFSIIALLIDFLLMSPIFIFVWDYKAPVAFGTRAVNAAVNLPVRIISFHFIRKSMDRPLKEIMKTQNKNKFKAYANSFQAVTVPGLERIDSLMKKLGNPENELRIIHIAGTNGKGSVSANIASILSSAGYKTGKYISPNLIRVNERISINEIDIPDNELNSVLSMIEPLSKETEKETGIAPTQFEIWTAAALYYFAKEKCDYVVLEVGLGGELDATNVIKKNVMAVITRLGIDHTQYLGNTPASVAEAKCGIIKDNSETGTLVTVEQDAEAMAVIRERVKKHGQKLLVAKPNAMGKAGTFERFTLDSDFEFKTGIAGYHQIENAALAVSAARVLGISDEIIKAGISKARNPARFEIIRDNPTVIYDGGHNENGIEALNRSLLRYFDGQAKVVVFACMADKEIKKSLELLSIGDTEFIFTTVKDNPRAMTAAALKNRAESLGFSGLAFEEIGDAYREAVSRDKLTVICGSLYLYKDFREFYDAEYGN